MTIDLPHRSVRGDIPLLITHFLSTRQLGKKPLVVEPDALQLLQGYDWPGNIRELANVIERAQILAEGDTITRDDLPDIVLSSTPSAAVPIAENPDSLDSHEKKHVMEMLVQNGGNKVQTAKTLGVSRRPLYRLLEKHGLETGTSAT